MPKRGRRRKKARTHVQEEQGTAIRAQTALASHQDEKTPKSLVMRRGKTAPEVSQLVQDVRHTMLPFTALNFQEDARNRKLTLSQYATHLALPMGVSHLMQFSQRGSRLHLRLARTPEGPTLQFRVHQFSLSKHIRSLQKRPVALTSALANTVPMVVTNNFGDATAAPHIKLLRITFQNLFPAINVATVKLADCRRVVLFHLTEQEIEVDADDTNEDESGDEGDAEKTDGDNNEGAEDKREDKKGKGKTDKPAPRRKEKVQIVEMRHYAIRANPVGVHRRVRRLVQSTKKLPNLHNITDIADYIAGNSQGGTSGYASDAASDSEPEDDGADKVVLPDRYAGRGNAASQTAALKLVELGPRLSLQLTKVEKGLGQGDVLYHAHIHKTPQEAAELKRRKEKEAAQKAHRKAQQEENVKRKRQAMEEKRQAKKQRQMERKEGSNQTDVSRESDDEE